MQRAVLLRAAGLLLAAGLLGALALARLGSTLLAPRFLTGWTVAASVTLVAALWWRAPADLVTLGRRARAQLALLGLVAALLLVHVEGRLPLGWVETGLFALAVAVGASAVAGCALAAERDAADLERRAASWLRVHAGLVGALLGLGLLHGALVHAHGLLAHLLLSGE